jgi:predicted tellurium resistance membrane protein TerC
MEWLTDPQAWVGLITLTALEIVLGIDNIIFIAILAGRLPGHLRSKGRTVGLGLAMMTRIALLLSIAWITRLTGPLFSVFSQEISGRDLIMFSGGLFLLVKSTLEIHSSVEAEPETADLENLRSQVSFTGVIFQIMMVDIVFSLDSVITAVGLAQQVSVMIIAIVIAVIIMMAMSGTISAFIEAHPTLKILALSFLLLIGLALIGESFDMHIPKGYIYFAMAFSISVEMLNMRLRRRHGGRPIRP